MNRKHRIGILWLAVIVCLTLLASALPVLAEGDGGDPAPDPTTYNYTWVFGNGQDNATESTTESRAEDAKGTPEWKGHTFNGWSKSEDGTNITYTAQWTVNQCTVKFVSEGSELSSKAYDYGTKAGDIAKPADPTKEATAENSYTFAGWDPEVADVTADATYTAKFDAAKRSYTITWKSDDGSTIETTTAEYGATPSHADATKADTAEYTYTFTGWDPAIAAVSGDATYTAKFDAAKRSYTVTWKNDDGSVIDTAPAEYGATPSHADPTKAEDEHYTYAFAGWTPAIAAVTGDAEYTASYNKTGKPFTVKFVDEDGATSLGETSYPYGTAAAGITAPTVADKSDEHYTYTFAAWEPALADVTGAATYKATYTKTGKPCTVTFVDSDGTTVLGTAQYPYGTAAAGVTAPTVADKSDEHYIVAFAAWEPAIADVTGDATYKATYTQTGKPCTITFVDADGTTVLKEAAQYPYGTAAASIAQPEAPVKAADETNTYTFAGWEPALADVTADATYKAVYTATPIAPQVVAIAQFQALPATGENLTYKPAIATELAKLPAELDVVLADGTAAKAPVTWSCANYDAAYDGAFVFTAALAENAPNPVAEGVAMPTFTLNVAPGVYTDATGVFGYRLNEQNLAAIITFAPTTATEVVVPETIEGAQVTNIEAATFKDQKTLTKIELPKGLKAIGDNAFEGCVALETLVVPDSLETLGANTTLNDAALKHLTLRTDLDSTMSAKDTVDHTVTAEDGTQTPYSMKLPASINDIIVNAGTLTLDCNYTVGKKNSVTVIQGATLTLPEKRTLTNNGTVTNYGTVTNNGTIISCGGTWGQNASTQGKKGSFTDKHVYESGVCTVCGAEEEFVVTDLTIAYKGAALTKVYDKTRNVTLKGSDFKISDTQEGHTAVRITAIKAAYDSADVGKRTVSVSFTIGGDDASRYRTKSISIPATITAKTLTITPTEGQKKVYGAADPTYFTGKVKGLLSGDTITGRLSREVGEDVGKYKIIQGTIDPGANYAVEVGEAYFEIEAKSINSSDVGLVTIGNQRYTGKAIEPEITLRFGANTLKKDTDFKVEYSDNKEPGTAKVKLSGMGNYTGERETTFRILNINSDGGSGSGSGSSGGSGGSGGSYRHSGFSDGDYEDADEDDDIFDDEDDDDEDEEDEDEDIGRLLLDDVDYGTVLFDSEGDPKAFVLFEEQLGTPEEPERMLTIIPEPMKDEETGASIYLEEGGREKYEESHLRLGTALIQTLEDKQVKEIIYEMEQADLHIPVASLVSEIPLDAPDASEGIEATDDTEELEIAPNTLQVAGYDICLEQYDAIEPEQREREDAVLETYEMIAPAYRVRVRVIPEGQEQQIEDPGLAIDPEQEALTVEDEEDDAEDEDEAVEPASPYEKLPEGWYPEGMTLMLLPSDDLEQAPEGAESVYISIIEDPEDVDEVQNTPVEFINQEGMLYANIPLSSDGVYTVTAPEGWNETGEFADLSEYEGSGEEEEGVDDFDIDEGDDGMEDFDEDFDFGGGSFGNLSGIGSTFEVDENGNPIEH